MNNRCYIERHTKTGNQEKVSCFFCVHFWYFEKPLVLCRAKRDRKKFPLPFGKSAGCPWRAGEKKFSQIPAYSGLCGFVRNREKFPQLSVIFTLRGVVGSRGRNIAAALAKSPLAALKVLREEYRRKVGRSPALSVEGISGSPHRGSRHFLRARFYHSTKFRLPAHFVLWESCWGLPPQARLFAACAA